MNFKIAKLPGDGIGPEVVSQAVKAVDAVCRRFLFATGWMAGMQASISSWRRHRSTT